MDTIERSMDYDDPLLAEIYDRCETGTDDIDLLRTLLLGLGPLNILECFSGTGRILVPLAADGHTVTGMEVARAMLDRAERKLDELGDEVRRRATLVVGDVLATDWGTGYDLVVMGANCLYELPSPQTQEECIRRASEAVAPGGHVFVDNDDASGHGADPSDIGTGWTALEETGADGTYGKLSAEVVDVDASTGVLHLMRTWYRRAQDGKEATVQYAAKKYPVSGNEIEAWLAKYGFEVVKKLGDRGGRPYGPDCCGRAIFWARKA